jgi:hypothetical protein
MNPSCAGMIITGWYLTKFFIFNMDAKWPPWQDGNILA